MGKLKMACINSITAERYAIEQDKADDLEEEWEAGVDEQVYKMIHKERLAGVILHMFENCLLEEPLVQCYLAETQEEKLAAYENLINQVEASLLKVAYERES